MTPAANIIPFPARPAPQQATFEADTETAAWALVGDLRAGPYPMPWVIMVTRPKWPPDRFVVTVH